MTEYRHYFWLCKCGNIYTCGYYEKRQTEGHCYCDGDYPRRFLELEHEEEFNANPQRYIEKLFPMYGRLPIHEITEMEVKSLTRQEFRDKYEQHDETVLDYDDLDDEFDEDLF